LIGFDIEAKGNSDKVYLYDLLAGYQEYLELISVTSGFIYIDILASDCAGVPKRNNKPSNI